MLINRINLNKYGQIIKYMDYISDSNNPYEISENISFSSDMMNVLSTLSPEDLSLIMLKYQENYSDDDLVSYLNLTID